jgi:hypothetical protein
MQRATFPYPKVDPTKSGNVGFQGDHSMTDDFTEYWWSETAPAPLGDESPSGAGAFCYVNQAARITPGNWPKGADPFLKGPCYTGPS